MANNIAIQISANAQQAVNGINSVNQKLDQMQKATETASSKFIRISAVAQTSLMALDRVRGVLQFIASSASAVVTAYTAQEQAERRLQAVLSATQGAVGMSASELMNLAESLQSVTTYSDQEIIAVEQMLAATRKIGRDIMPEATKAVLDMAAATGDDAAGAAHDLAQALSDPAGEIESLKEKGIQLTEKQAENIKTVQEQNGLYAAQKILLQEVAGTYGGMAEAIADTDTGKLQKIADVWTDIKEGLGEGLLNTIGPALDWIYERLTDISGWIDEQNARHDIAAESAGYRAAGTTDLSEASNEVLDAIIRDSAYGRWLSDIKKHDSSLTDADIATIAERGIAVGGLSREDMLSYNAAVVERENRRNLSRLENLWKTQDIYRNSGFSGFSLTPWQENVAPFYAQERLGIGQQFAAKAAAEEALRERRTQSASALSGFLDQYGGLSTSRQVAALDDAIRASQSWMASIDPGSDVHKQLEEINAALYEERDALLSAGDAGESAAEKMQEAFSKVQDYLDPIFSIGESFADIMQNMADAAEAELSRIEEKWDEYFDELDKKQDRQSESLNALLVSGALSYEDYIDAMDALDKDRAEAEEEAEKEKEKQREKANALGEAAFAANQANQIAEVVMNTASAIMAAWADNPNPVAAGILTGLISAASAAQIAAISSQEYTPLAAGGITQGPTHILAGEGTPHELVMPLTDGNIERFGLGGAGESGVINVNISIGTVYSKDQLSDEIFHAIERAQRTGALPSWRYA